MRLPTRDIDRRRGWRAVAAVAALTAAAGGLASCGDDDPSITGGATSTSSAPATSTTVPPAACGPDVAEPLDPNSSRHVFPGAAEPAYTTDPPTSGPHRLGQHPTGLVDTPIERPVQVGMLEGGAVLVQYRDAAARDVLAPLAGGDVTVAPNPNLPAAVVATAWLHKQTCTGLVLADLRAFVTAHAGQAEAH